MARSTRRSKPDQRGAETLGGLPAQLHAIRKVGFDQLVRENACKDTRRAVLACSPWRDLKTLYFELPRESHKTGGASHRLRGPVSSSPSCAWNLARGSVVVECGYSEGHFHSIRQRFHACFLDIRDRKLAARTVSSKHVAMHSVVSMSSSFSVVSGVGFVE